MIDTIGLNNIKKARTINQLLMIVFFVFLSINTYAVGKYTEEGTISRFRLGTDGDIVIYHTSSTHLNPDSCSKDNYYRVSSTIEYYNALYSLLLTAFTTQQSITLYVNGCEDDYSRVTTAYIRLD